MIWNSFPKSLIFAVVAALGAVPALIIAGPWLGSTTAATAYLVGAISLYLCGIAPNRARAVRAGLMALTFGVVILLLANSVAQAAVAMTVALALIRSGLLYRSSRERGLVAEVIVGASQYRPAAFDDTLGRRNDAFHDNLCGIVSTGL